MMHSKYIVILLTTLVIGFGLGFFTQKLTATTQKDPEIARLRSQIEKAKRFFPPEQSAINTLSGTIKTVSGRSIALDVNLPNPFQDVPLLRTVRITDKTTIIKFEQKDPAIFRTESLEFQRKTVKLPTGPGSSVQLVPPSPFREKPGALADLKIGQSVSVTANEDIAAKESFDAASINIIITARPAPAQ